MDSIFNLCSPRDEVLQGELREDIFAARLKDVMDGVADPVYGDAKKFFENTYPTSGLKTLLNEVLGRLVGDAAGKNAVIRLETAFGGGKTHNLIALYHAASGMAPVEIVSEYLGSDLRLPDPGEVAVRGVVGSDLDPTVGILHPEHDLRTYTLWGELVYQLGGESGYQKIRESDEHTKSAPGTGLFEELVADQPTLIMIDEIARHLRAALAVPTATGETDLAKQTVAFLMSLLEFAASQERCQVVLTLAGETDAFAKETEMVRQALAETLSISARQERVLTPTTEGEIYAIVTHRLFESVDRQGGQAVFDGYARYYGDLMSKNTDLPQRCLRAEYIQEMVSAYPFHPELLTTLNRKTATIPNFNQTRGALRLLAWTVRQLWATRPESTWLIHPYHLDLSQEKIAEDLTSRLDRPKFRQVIEADITSPMKGTSSHAQEIDEPLVAVGRPAYAQRLATTIFLHSLTQGIASGVDPADLRLAVLQPDSQGGGDDPAVVNKTLERLVDQAWFLEYDGHRYRFNTEPSMNKIIADETLQVGPSKAKGELEGRIRQIWKKGYFQPIYFPVEAVDVDDDAGLPKLAIVHFEATTATPGESDPPDLVRKIYQYSGTLESFRKYQNNLVFLVADEDQVDHMVDVARRYLAISRIVGDTERMAEFAEDQREKLKKAREAAELDVRVAITKAYRYLYYPTGDAPKANLHLQRETLPAQDQGDVDKDQTNVVLRVLRELNKILTADDNALSARFVKDKAWDRNQTSMSTEDLRRAFARKIGLRILLDPGQLRKTIENGVKTGVWVYYDSQEQFGYDVDSPPPVWQISEEALLYTPEEAARLEVRIKGKWQPPAPDGDRGPSTVSTCPVCHNPIDQCTCSVAPDPSKPAKVTGAGAVLQAFQQIQDLCQEHEYPSLAKLYITIEGLGKQIANDVRALGLGIPQFGKGNFAVEQELVASFGDVDVQASYSQSFEGGWERYKRLKTIVEAFAQEASELQAKMRVGCAFEDGLKVGGDRFDNIREVLAALEVGKITLEGVPMIQQEQV